MGAIPSITVNTTPPCLHVPQELTDWWYVEPPKYPGDLTYKCPCCGATAYAKADETLPPCHACGVEAVEA